MNVEQYVTRVPDMYRNAFQKALAGKVSPRQAIKQKCLDCCCFQRKEAADCRVPSCPLYAYNPLRRKFVARSAVKSNKLPQGVSRVGSDND